MSGKFVHSADIERESLDWGGLGWISRPTTTGASGLTVLDVTLEPGHGHDFHRHPEQEEVIVVQSGEIEQWLEREQTTLGPGEAVFIGAGTVHASFNVGIETGQLVFIVIAIPLLALVFRAMPRNERLLTGVISAVIALIAGKWLVERLDALAKVEWPAIEPAVAALWIALFAALALLAWTLLSRAALWRRLRTAAVALLHARLQRNR